MGAAALCFYQPDMGCVWLLWFLFKLVPRKWMYNEEEKEKTLGEKSEKDERNGKHHPPWTGIFVRKNILSARHLQNKLIRKEELKAELVLLLLSQAHPTCCSTE